jgi:hypothetical protein
VSLRAASFRLRGLTCSVYPFIVTATSCVGGAEEIRTPDLRRAKAALSQLSYGPTSLKRALAERDPYYWWAMVDSNHRPRSYQDRALTS